MHSYFSTHRVADRFYSYVYKLRIEFVHRVNFPDSLVAHGRTRFSRGCFFHTGGGTVCVLDYFELTNHHFRNSHRHRMDFMHTLARALQVLVSNLPMMSAFCHII